MTTAEIINQMEKEFDERFPGDVTTMEEDGMYARITSSLYNRDRLKSFILSYIRTLLEAFGEEIIGENELDINSIGEEEMITNDLRDKQRLKMKEIISSIGE